MQPLRLNFLDNPRVKRRGGGVILATGLLVALLTFFYARSLATQVQTLEEQLQQQTEKGKGVAPLHVAKAGTAAAVQQAPLAGFNTWHRLFAALEAPANDEITLLTLQVDATGRKLQVSGEARDMNALAAYVLQQEKSAQLGNVFLRHTRPLSGPGHSYVEFSLEADWEGQ